MVKYYYFLMSFLFISTNSFAEIKRPNSRYASTNNHDQDIALCRGRYGEEASFTKEKILKNLPKSCAINGQEIDAIIALAQSSEDLMVIAQRYEALMASLAQCRLEALLTRNNNEEKAKALSLKDTDTLNKTLLHVLGDVFGEESGFEGSNADIMLSHRIEMLKTIKSRIGGEHAFINDADHQKPCLHLNVVHYDKSYPQPDIADKIYDEVIAQSELALNLYELARGSSLIKFQTVLKETLQNLAHGQSIYFPSSWSHHAIAFVLTKEDKEHITFKIYNSGDGINIFHPRLKTLYGDKYLPYLAKKHVPLTTMNSLVTLAALKEIYSPRGQATKPESFYLRFLPLLGGEAEPFSHDETHYKNPQNAGTCSYANLPWVMSSCLATNIVKEYSFDTELISSRLESMINLLTLHDYRMAFAAIKTLHSDYASINLLKKSMTHFSARLVDELLEGIIANRELTPVIKELKLIENTVSNAEEQVEAQEKSTIPPFVSTKVSDLAFPKISFLPREDDLDDAKTLLKPEPNIILVSQPPKIVDVPTTWQDGTHKNLSQYVHEVENMVRNHQTKHIPLNVEKIARLFPLEAKAYASLSADECHNFIVELSRLAQLYFYSLHYIQSGSLSRKSQLTMPQILVAIKLLTVADLINQTNLKIFPSFYSATWGNILHGDLAVVTTLDPAFQKQFLMLKDYYKNPAQTEFFGFDIVPAGANYDRRLYDDESAADAIKNSGEDSPNYEDNKEFPDLAWAMAEVRKIETSDKFMRWCESQHFSDYTFSWRNSAPSANLPSLEATKPLSRKTTDNLRRRAAITLIKQPDQGVYGIPSHISQIYSHAKTLATIADFLLTGNLAALSNVVYTYGKANQVLFRSNLESKKQYVSTVNRTQGFAQEIKTTVYEYYLLSLNIFGAEAKKLNYRAPYAENVIDETLNKTVFSYQKPYASLMEQEGLFNVFSLRDNSKDSLMSYPNEALISLINQTYHSQKFQEKARSTHIRFSPNQITHKNSMSQNVASIKTESMRALYNLSAVPSLQIDQTLNYFYANYHLLGDNNAAFRLLFEKLIFSPPLLELEWQKNAHHKNLFATRLAKFCRVLFTKFKRNQDLFGQAFILKINDLLRESAENNFVQVDQFLNSVQALLEIDNVLLPKQRDEIAFIHGCLTALFEKRSVKNKNEAQALLHAVLSYNLYRPLKTPWLNEEYVFNKSILYRHYQDIKQFIAGNESDTLSKIINELHLGIYIPLWQRHQKVEHIFVGEDAKTKKVIHVDIVQGEIYIDNNRLGAFPIPTTEFYNTFGKNAVMPKQVELISHKTYQWVDSITSDVIRAYEDNNGWIYQRRYKQDWFHLLRPRDLEKIKPTPAIVPHQLNWLEVRLDSSNSPKKKILITQPETGKLDSIVSINDQMIEWIRDADQKIELVNSDDEISLPFSSIENKTFIRITKNISSHHVEEISLPRLGLSFKPLENQDTLSCASISGYKVARDQYIALLGLPKTYLVCEAIDAKKPAPKKILMVAQNYKKQKSKTGLTHQDILLERFENNKDEDFSSSLLHYNFDGKKLIPQSRAAQWYLALRYLWQQKYDDVKDLFDPESSDLGIFSPIEKKIAAWILSGNSQDNDIRSLALRLNALLLLGKNYLFHADNPVVDFSKKDNEFSALCEKQQELYRAYINKLPFIETHLLSLKDENIILSWYIWHIDDFSKNQVISLSNRHSPNDIIKRRYEQINRTNQSSDLSFSSSNTSGAKFFAPEKMIKTCRETTSSQLGELFTSHKAEPISNLLTAESRHLIADDNIALFYKAAHNDPFDENDIIQARQLLKKFIQHDDEIDLLSYEEIKNELYQLIEIATLIPNLLKIFGGGDHKKAEVAVFLKNVALATKASKTNTLPTWATLKETPSHEYFEQNNLFNETFAALPKSTNTIAQTKTLKDTSPKEPHKRMITLNIPQVMPITHQIIFDPLAENLEILKYFDPIFGEHDKEAMESANKKITAAFAQINEKLKEALKAENISSATKKNVEKLNERLATVKDSLLEMEQFHVRNWEQVANLQTFLTDKIAQLEKEALEIKTNKIMIIVNKYDPTNKDAIRFELLKYAGLEKQRKFEDVIYSLLVKKLDPFYLLNVSIVNDEVIALKHNLLNFLVLSTTKTYLENLLEKTNELISLKDKDNNDADLKVVTHEFSTLLSTKRAYNVAEHNDYLVFEYFKQKIMRQTQKTALDMLRPSDKHSDATAGLSMADIIKSFMSGQRSSLNMFETPKKKDRGQVLELGMGIGKTTYITPTLCDIFSDKNKLNVVVLPESLIASMAQELSDSMNEGFRKYIDVMQFENGKILNDNSLPILKKRFINAREEGRTIVTTNASLQHLFLTMINMFESEKNHSSNSLALKEIKQIFNLFREHGNLIIDEVDLALDVMRAQQIAAGHKLFIDDVLKDTVVALYNLMATDADIYDQFSLSFLPFARGDSITEKNFAAFKNKLVEKLVTVNSLGTTFFYLQKTLDNTYRAYLSKFGSEDIRNYFIKPTIENRRKVLDNIDDESLKGALAVVAEELHSILEVTIIKKNNVHYGPLPKPEKNSTVEESLFKHLIGEYAQSEYVAIPYQNGVPLVRSRFASAIEQVNYTIQKDLAHNNITSYITKEIDSLKRLGSSNPDFLARYEKLLGKDAKSIDLLTSKDIEKLAQSFQDKNRVTELLGFTKQYALSQITVFEKQLMTNAFIYEFMFHTVQGFAGTLWNYLTYPDIFEKYQDFIQKNLSDTSPLTILTLLKDPAPVRAIISGSLKSLVQQIYKQSFAGSFIDEAGMLTAFSNQEVAQAILEILTGNNNVDGIIFYDHKNDIVVMDKLFNLVPLNQCSLSKEKLIAYWDKSHTTGSDLKLKNRMEAKISIDRHLKLRDLEQASWRLRGLTFGQRIVEYVAFAQDLKHIATVLKETYQMPVTEHNISCAGIVTYSILHQENILEFLKWRSFGMGLKNQMIKAATCDILDTWSMEKSLYTFKSSRDLFVSTNPQHLYDVYGLPVTEEKKADAIVEELKLKRAYKAFNLFNNDEAMEKQFSRIVKEQEDDLPDMVKMPRFSSHGTQVQIQLNLQAQERSQTQTSTMKFDPQKMPPQDIVFSWNLFSRNNIYDDFFATASSTSNAAEINWYNTTECAQKKAELAVLFKALSKNIFLSKNFAPVHDANFMFFDQHAKELSNVLVIFDAQENNYYLIMLDLNDVNEWKAFLLNDQDTTTTKSRRYAFGLYSLLSNTRLADSVNMPEQNEVNNDDRFKTLTAQAKFLAGILTMEDREKPLLKAWLDDNDLSALRIIFKNHIMSFRDASIEDYKGSFIAELFFDSDS